MPNGKFEQKPEEIKPEEQEEKTEGVSFETREGEKFFVERLTNPEDPRVEEVQEMLTSQFGKAEVDPVEVMRQTMTGKMEAGEEVPPYLIHVAERTKAEVEGLQTGAVVETVNAEGEVSEKSGVLLGCYSVVSPEMRGQGVWKKLFQAQEKTAREDAESRGLEVKGFITEARGEMEPIFNGQEVKRAYIKTKEGAFQELPYEQPPLDWSPKTGKPTKDAGIVLEHLMLKLTSGENKLSGKQLMEMVRGMYYYNNYREEGYFEEENREKAYQRHNEFVEGIEEKLADFIGRKAVRLLSREEREAMEGKGINFIEHKTEEEIKPETKSKAEMKKEWKEHFGPELIDSWGAQLKAAEKELAEEKTSVESAKIPEKEMEAEEILKRAGIEKPAESSEEVQKRLEEKLEKDRIRGGEALSLADKNEMTRDFYLSELGYSVKYKGLLHGKAELLDESGKAVIDEKGKSMEFKTSFNLGRKETPMIDFLKEELKTKFEGKPEKERTEEEKWEVGAQKVKKTTEREQVKRVEAISSLADVKRVGKERLSKVEEGLSYVMALDKLGILGMREGKKLAIEGGKDLAAIGLSPAVALEEAGREIAGRIKLGESFRKQFITERRIESLERIPAERRTEEHDRALEFLRQPSQKLTEEQISAWDLMLKKGKILSRLEKWGRFGKLMGERLTPHIR